MRLRNVPGAREYLAGSRWVIQDPDSHKGSWRSAFGAERADCPLHIEIGTGKGKFITAMAERHPEICYVGIDRYSSVLYRAVQKQDEKQLPNLLFVCYDAELILNLFGEGEVSRIYLNFSDPWPKKSHAHRRLPSKEYLRRYAVILEPEGTVEFKTDNRELFDFAVDEVPQGGFRIDALTYDLHADTVMNAGNIMTEYEERFSGKGNRICKYILSKSAADRPFIPECAADRPSVPAGGGL